MAKINVTGTDITVISIDEKDYISLTDMVRNIDNGLALIEKWLRNKNTIEFIGIWEEMYNPDFNSPEFGTIKNSSGSNNFVTSATGTPHKVEQNRHPANERLAGSRKQEVAAMKYCDRMIFAPKQIVSGL